MIRHVGYKVGNEPELPDSNNIRYSLNGEWMEKNVDLTQAQIDSLQEQGYIVLTPEEMEALGHTDALEAPNTDH